MSKPSFDDIVKIVYPWLPERILAVPTDPRIPEQDLRCPDCGSGDVEPIYYDSGQWECHNCVWIGFKDELKREG